MEEYDLRVTSYEKWGQGYASQWELMSDLFAWVDLRLYLFYKHHQWLGPKNDMRNMLGLVVSREEFEHNLMKGAQLGLTAQLDGQEAEELTATAAVIRSRLGHTREEFPLSQLFQRCMNLSRAAWSWPMPLFWTTSMKSSWPTSRMTSP